MFSTSHFPCLRFGRGWSCPCYKCFYCIVLCCFNGIYIYLYYTLDSTRFLLNYTGSQFWLSQRYSEFPTEPHEFLTAGHVTAQSRLLKHSTVETLDFICWCKQASEAAMSASATMPHKSHHYIIRDSFHHCIQRKVSPKDFAIAWVKLKWIKYNVNKDNHKPHVFQMTMWKHVYVIMQSKEKSVQSVWTGWMDWHTVDVYR